MEWEVQEWGATLPKLLRETTEEEKATALANDGFCFSGRIYFNIKRTTSLKDLHQDAVEMSAHVSPGVSDHILIASLIMWLCIWLYIWVVEQTFLLKMLENTQKHTVAHKIG